MKVCGQCGTIYAEDSKFCTRDGALLETGTPSDPFAGVVIDERYRLSARIGAGSFGLVYRASHERIPRELAVKILSQEMSQDPQWVARFEREVKAQALLDHPNIIQVFDYGLSKKVGYYIVMEYLAGEDLASRLERDRTLPILEIYKVMFEAGGALSAAHAIDIIHRDIKPENIFLAENTSDDDGYAIRLLDFGIAKVIRATEHLPDLSDVMETTSGYIAGSPYTMSPEQVRCEGVDSRSDIYSLGCILYEMLSGNVPFYGESAQELWAKHMNTQPDPPSRVEGAEWIIPDLDEVVLWMLAKDNRDRPPSVDDVLDALEYIRPSVEEAWASHFLLPSRSRRGGSLSSHYGSKNEDRAHPQVFGTKPTETEESVIPAAFLSRPPITFHPNRTHRVLVVDDDRMIRSLVRRLVTRDGMEPILMEKGEKALRWLRDHMDVDAIILDLMMPGLDGFTVMKMARAQGYEGPIIIISSLHSNDIREQALRDGAVHFINKSTDMHLIPTVLNQLKRAAAMYHEKRMKNKGSTTLAQSADDVFDVELGGSMPDPFSD